MKKAVALIAFAALAGSSAFASSSKLTVMGTGDGSGVLQGGVGMARRQTSAQTPPSRAA